MTSSPTTAPTTPNSRMHRVNGLRDIADSYDIFLLDMWGCLHDGQQPYKGVLEAMDQLSQKENKHLVVLSNSSKRMDHSIRMLTKLGFDVKQFDQVITSGEVGHDLLSGAMECEWMNNVLAQIDGPNSSQEKTVFVLGSGDGDVEYCESAGWTVGSLENASLIVARGTFTIHDGVTEIRKLDRPSTYASTLERVLAQAAVRQVPMLLTNPDKIRPDADRSPMPGTIGDDYARVLNLQKKKNADETLILRVGKPLPLVYQRALSAYDNDDKSRVCMVGDALETDIVGGNRAAIDTVWVVRDGIHGPELDADDSSNDGLDRIVERFNDKKVGTYAGNVDVSPTIVMPRFQW